MNDLVLIIPMFIMVGLLMYVIIKDGAGLHRRIWMVRKPMRKIKKRKEAQ